MSYTALYRKFRPQEFEDVKGQEHIVTTLKNQIKADRIGSQIRFRRTGLDMLICFAVPGVPERRQLQRFLQKQ